MLRSVPSNTPSFFISFVAGLSSALLAPWQLPALQEEIEISGSLSGSSYKARAKK
jgi:hypothetical protein